MAIAAQIAEALEEAESRGIVHCDIKPKNIFVGKSEFTRLGDFGVARATAEWILDGHPVLPVHEMDVNRFEKHQMGHNHIVMRGSQNFVEVVDRLSAANLLIPQASPSPLLFWQIRNHRSETIAAITPRGHVVTAEGRLLTLHDEYARAARRLDPIVDVVFGAY